MHKTTFSTNDTGKLLCQFFSTDRRPDDKYFIGNVHEIYLRKYYLGTAIIKAVRTFKINQYTDSHSFLTNGHNVPYTKAVLQKIYGPLQDNDFITEVVFQWLSHHPGNQRKLFTDWFQTQQNRFSKDYSSLFQDAEMFHDA